MGDNLEEVQTLPFNEVPATGYNCESDLQNLTKRVKRLELLAYLIILMVGVSIMLPLTRQSTSSVGASDNKQQKELPASVDTTELISKIQQAYNDNDDEMLYSYFGDYARARITKEEISKTIDGIRPGLGKLNDVKYSNYTYLGHQDGADWFNIIYVGEYDSGPGSVEVSIRVVDNKYDFVGFQFKLGQNL